MLQGLVEQSTSIVKSGALPSCEVALVSVLTQFGLGCLGGVLLHPLAGRGIMLGPVLQVDLCNLWH